MRRVLSLLLAAAPLFAQTEDDRLRALRDLLVPLRGHPHERIETRGATAQLTVVKHQLRDWIESRLSALTPRDDPAVLARQLNQALKQGKLFCDDSSDETRCPEDSLLGFLDEIHIEMPLRALLVVRTAVGIEICGVDESAYAYQWSGNRWQRFWESEQNDYSEKKYLPQLLTKVTISSTNYDAGADKSEHLLLTLGRNPWCSSNWQPIYYRVWQTRAADPQPRLLLDEMDYAYLGSDVLEASLSPNDVLIEYAVGSIDSGVHNRREVRHYVINRGAIERIDPIVLSPRDFADT